MEALILAALAGVAYWVVCTVREGRCRGPGEGGEAGPGALCWDPEAAAERLAPVLAELLAVMDHPELGGPGYLSVRLTRQGEAEAVCRFPSLSGTLCGLAERGEADRRRLEALGVSAALLDRGVRVEAEGSGVTALTVRCAVPPLPEGIRAPGPWRRPWAGGSRGGSPPPWRGRSF